MPRYPGTRARATRYRDSGYPGTPGPPAGNQNERQVRRMIVLSYKSGTKSTRKTPSQVGPGA
eukprot:2194931-Rhodomonas_salina.1